MHVDPKQVSLSEKEAVSVWEANHPVAEAKMSSGTFSVHVPAGGITAVEIAGAQIAPKFQQKVASGATGQAWRVDAIDAPLGRAHARLLNVGPDLRSVYFYLEASGQDVRSVKLHYTTTSGQHEVEDTSFPFEFSIPVDANADEFKFRYEVQSAGGTSSTSEELRLEAQ